MFIEPKSPQVRSSVGAQSALPVTDGRAHSAPTELGRKSIRRSINIWLLRSRLLNPKTSSETPASDDEVPTNLQTDPASESTVSATQLSQPVQHARVG